jgi:hypothetical protein
LLSGIKSRASAASASIPPASDPFKEARNAYLNAESPNEDDDTATDLPLRMAYTENEGRPDLAADITRHLWLFNTATDQRDLAVDAFGSYSDLDSE